MKPYEFDKFCEDKIKLRQPRPEEERAEKDVLVTDKARGQGGEAEQGPSASASSSYPPLIL